MLLRFVAENIASFKDAVEFNTFPSSKSHSHENHKIACGHATALRMSAIYGANGAGKSNLLVILNFLKGLVEVGSIRDVEFFDALYFKFAPSCKDKPSGLAIEFYHQDNVFYYHIEFNRQEILMEELYLSKKTKDVKLFVRNQSKISMNGDYAQKGINEQFIDALDRLVRPDMLLLSFLGKYYPTEVPLITDAYTWFCDMLQVVLPTTMMGIVPHLFDKNPAFSALVNSTIPELKTGISKLVVHKEILNEEEIKNNSDLLLAAKQAKLNPGEPQISVRQHDVVVNVVFEDNTLYVKTLVAVHQNLDGTEVEMPLVLESDGTRRLIEYMPLLFAVTQDNMVYVVDEIERSIHPIMIKDIVRKLSESETAKGQLIFTTHESGLLDQSIFRPDEIWFAQKDAEQATQLYPLSDYNIHKTANIENGYLNGRYGGIPQQYYRGRFQLRERPSQTGNGDSECREEYWV